MSVFLSRENFIYEMSPKHKPVLIVSSGTQLVIETYDCFLNQITSSETMYQSIDWTKINPATGPIFVEEAEPGDVLVVNIQKIELADKGVMVTGPDLGVMGGNIDNFSIKIVPIHKNKAIFNEKIQLSINPMIGVIGVAPKKGEISCGTPGEHGGNMDTTLITEGATVYFPVFQKGALFSLGDVHAAMGDGEVGVSGIEIPAKVTVTLSVLKEVELNTPLVENQEGIAFIVSKKTLDEAADSAVKEMVDYLHKRTHMGIEEISMLLSATGQVQVSQIVDPLKTARCFLPKNILNSYNIFNIL